MTHGVLAPRVVTLGVAGGPRWWRDAGPHGTSGIATAVVVGDAYYLVDCGSGVGRNLMLAGLPLNKLRAIFLTHLHSDHTVDLPSLMLFSTYEISQTLAQPITILGPGDRGILPPLSARAKTTRVPLFPESPTPGTTEMFDHLCQAFATDLNDRYLDGLRPSPFETFAPRDILIPGDIGYHPNTNPTPAMQPFEIYRDDVVRVTAILVEHPPVAPAFAFRFESEGGSVTISGDTTYTENMVTLAQGTDLLLHEVIDEKWIEKIAADSPSAQATIDHHLRAHTTVADNIRLAQESGATKMLLHHLVPGNARASIEEQLVESAVKNITVAQDLESTYLK